MPGLESLLSGLVFKSKFKRHDPARPGHPRLSFSFERRKDVDGPNKSGHDGFGVVLETSFSQPTLLNRTAVAQARQ